MGVVRWSGLGRSLSGIRLGEGVGGLGFHKVWFREMGVETGVDEGDFFCASGISV